MPITVAALHRYVVKSCRGEALAEATLDARGIADDRRFMVVDEQGGFLTQRQLPALALIVPRLEGSRLRLDTADRSGLAIDLTPPRPRRAVTVWEHHGQGEDCGDEAAAWLSAVLGRATRLVRMPDDAVRAVDPRFAVTPADQTAFSDGFPLLLINRASLAALAARLAEPVPSDRFRANLVIEGAEAFAEDHWTRIRVGEVEFAVVKPCARCAITTVDQATAARGPEPLRALAAFRTVGNKVMFGQNLVHRGLGTLHIGDTLSVL